MKKKKAGHRAAYTACKNSYSNMQTTPLEGYTDAPGEENRIAGGVEGVLSSSYFFARLDSQDMCEYYTSHFVLFLSHIFKLRYNFYTIKLPYKVYNSVVLTYS